ncbi:hypothetical protein PGTUg99_009162 [Puccinia graminis f. sp. tritici]|uniref:Uncharacterized protein n=1 Tax=Puccinia graminis f. sp. tritici TaxID=56615 RepID=A0A5B0RWV6_PUCGR|nr:hypothetical protein PGTUg99_009162 [Puccinia graminis f. sp. tritici]
MGCRFRFGVLAPKGLQVKCEFGYPSGPGTSSKTRIKFGNPMYVGPSSSLTEEA